MTEIIQKLDRFRASLTDRTIICFSMDVDWASDYAIEQAAKLFTDRALPVTVFLTHKSQTVDYLRAQNAIKCGIHPNFMPDSSQGGSYQEVIDTCFDILPDARVFRSHRYYEVNDITDALKNRGIVCSSNVCTMMESIPPFVHRSGMISFPVFWEDGGYLAQYEGHIDYDYYYKRLMTPGVKVINMHPMHIMLNTPYFKYTREIKDQLSRGEWNTLNREAIDRISWKGSGITTFITRMLDDVKASGFEVAFIEDVYNRILEM